MLGNLWQMVVPRETHEERMQREIDRAVETVNMTRRAARMALSDLPYGMMLRTVLETIEGRHDSTTETTREFANKLSRWCDSRERNKDLRINAPLTDRPPKQMDVQFTVSGWTYRTSDEHSDCEVRKWSHWATQGNFAHQIEWSPYKMLTPVQFRHAIEQAQLL